MRSLAKIAKKNRDLIKSWGGKKKVGRHLGVCTGEGEWKMTNKERECKIGHRALRVGYAEASVFIFFFFLNFGQTKCQVDIIQDLYQLRWKQIAFFLLKMVTFFKSRAEGGQKKKKN